MGASSSKTNLERVATYLREELRQSDGPLYIKSRFMTDDLGLSSHAIGTAMGRLADRDGDLTIERWANSGGTTWYVAGSEGTADTDS